MLPYRPGTRLAARHTGATARLDSEMRANLAAVLTALGWEPGTRLVLRLLPAGRAEVTATTPDAPLARAEHLLTPDRQQRLRLPAPARSWLEVAPGDQLACLALPGAGRLLLGNPEHLWLALLAGEAIDAEPEQTAPTHLPEPRRSGPRPARGTERVPAVGIRPLRAVPHPH